MKTKHALLLVLSLVLGTRSFAAPFAWNNSLGGLWSTPGDWLPSGPPGSADEANFGDFGSGLSVDLANPFGTAVYEIYFLNNTTVYTLFDANNVFPTPFEILSVNSITHNGSADVYIASTGITGLSLTNNSGYLAFIGTNQVTMTNAEINAGTVCVNAFFPSQINIGVWNIYPGGTLKVNGFLTGTINVLGGTFSAGCSPGMVAVQGDLFFGPGGIAEFELDFPNLVGGGSDWIVVNGALTLDGTLTVLPQANFGAGVYRLFDYTGPLTNNGVQLGPLPAGFAGRLDFTTPNQVNLAVLAEAALSITSSNGNAVISWTNALYHLQSSPTPATGWADIPGASPVTLPFTNTAQFFRLANP